MAGPQGGFDVRGGRAPAGEAGGIPARSRPSSASPGKSSRLLRRLGLAYVLAPAVGGLLTVLLLWAGRVPLPPGPTLGAAVLLSVALALPLADRGRAGQGPASAESDPLGARVPLDALASTDALTGLPNHRVLNQTLDREIDRCQRDRRPCCVLVVDLDDFGSVNDARGYLAGDGILVELGRLVRGLVRRGAAVGRWGGDEVLVILPGADGLEGIETAERVRVAVATRAGRVGSGHPTCSIGVAAFPGDAGERAELLGAAQRALIAAKRLGRNQVRVAHDPAAGRPWPLAAVGGFPEEPTLAGMLDGPAAPVDALAGFPARRAANGPAIPPRPATAPRRAPAEGLQSALVARLRDVGPWPRVRAQTPADAEVVERIGTPRAPSSGADLESRAGPSPVSSPRPTRMLRRRLIRDSESSSSTRNGAPQTPSVR